MFVYDLETLRIRKANVAAFRVYGYDEDEMVGLPISKLGESEESLFSFRPAVSGNDDLFESKEIRHKDKNGNTFGVKVSYQDIEDQNDESPARLVVIHDISRKKNVSNEEKAYDELNYLIQNSPLAMVRWDKNFRIEEWSDRAEEMTGYKKEEVKGKTPYVFEFYNVKDIRDS